MKKTRVVMVAGIFVLGTLWGCNGDYGVDFVSTKQAAELAGSQISIRVGVELWKEGSPRTQIFKQDQGSSVQTKGKFQIANDGSYSLVVSSSMPEVPLQMSLDSAAPFPVIPGVSIPIPSAQFPMPAVGSHPLKIQAQLNGGWTTVNDLTLDVSCASSISNSIALDANRMIVSSVATNVYSYGASGIASGGVGPFDCAWDFNGDGVQDSDFATCSSAVVNYSNHVDMRKIGVFVKDRGCNKVFLVEADRQLTAPAYSAILGMKPNVYITGTISGSSASLVAERAVNLRHLSTNPPESAGLADNRARVACQYGSQNGSGTFSVFGLNAYQQVYSQKHGLSLSVKGIVDTLNLATGVGSVSRGPATALNKVTFATDEQPDVKARMLFEGTSQCTLNSFTVAAIPSGGVPCAQNANGVANAYVIQGEGTFSCTNLPSATGGTVNIQQGAFYCEYRLVDQCVGGGGGGGGGVDPIYF